MNDTIKKIKSVADKEEIYKDELEEIFINGHDLDDKNEFHSFLKQYNFKHLHQEGGGEGGTEYCEAVIELDGQAFKLEYSYSSYNGFDIDDIWDWKPVTPRQKTITVYE